jgi:hypothetical protein
MTAQQPQREWHTQRCYNGCIHFDMHDHPKTVYCCLTGPGMIMRNSDILLMNDVGCASYQNAESPHTPASDFEQDCYKCREATARTATLAAQKEERHQMLLRDIASRETPEKYPVFIQGLGWLSFDMAWDALQSLRQSTAEEQQQEARR